MIHQPRTKSGICWLQHLNSHDHVYIRRRISSAGSSVHTEGQRETTAGEDADFSSSHDNKKLECLNSDIC